MSRTDAPGGAAPQHDATLLEQNLKRLEALSERLVQVMTHKRQVPAALQGPAQDLYLKAATAYVADIMANPAKLIEHQVDYWAQTMRHYARAQQGLTGQPPEAPTPQDARFGSPLWDANPWFGLLRDQYLLNARTIQDSVAQLPDLEGIERQRITYFTKQIIDMMSPTNFLGTNPDALEHALETNGQSLIDGLENLVRDLEAHDGELIVTLSDPDAFEVGGNIGTTKGEVVWRNHMLELIQYAPRTEKVHSTPLILFPPWINKFYILDLKEKNSLIRWIVDQGYTLFVVSWRNPGPEAREIGMEDYVESGFLSAIAQVKDICGTKKVNAVGYCIAGTTLAAVLALMAQRKDSSIKSATFFTTLTDFSRQGEFGVFLTNDFVNGIEEEIARKGILESFYMTRTFSFLRSQDLIYGPAIRSYMMGQAPPAFDLLYWNGDGTNLPGRMAVEYLRHLCQGNALATKGFDICGTRVDLSQVKTPLCAIACETDHIAAWDSSYRGIQKMGSKDKRFILTQSGHIAGIVNPPSKKKYGHFTHEDLTLTPEDWRAAAEAHEGSWWPTWEAWLAPRSGKMVPARAPQNSLAPAPGPYVTAAPGTV